MASIKTRGPKNARRYFVNYDIGRTAEGKRVQRMHLLKGVEDMRQARQELARVERELSAGKDPFAEVRAPEAMGPLLERWRDGLTNRNADDDRSRIDRQLVPKFRSMLLEGPGQGEVRPGPPRRRRPPQGPDRAPQAPGSDR
jgi:hypothetical protein